MYCFVTEGNVLTDATLCHTDAGQTIATAVIRVDEPGRRDDGTCAPGPTTDYEVTVQGKAAGAFAASARRGARVIAAGDLAVEHDVDGAGVPRLRYRFTAEHHGISTRYAPAVNTRRNGDR